MTIVVALQDDDGVMIGCDTLAQGGGIVLSYNEKKWIEHDCGLWVGLSGEACAAELIRSVVTVNIPCSVEEFCSHLRVHLHKAGWESSKGEHGDMPSWSLNLLLTDGGTLWESGSSLYPWEVELGDPRAVGCGHQLALGAMMVSKKEKYDPEDIVLSGLETAIHYDVHCGGKPWVHRLLEGDR